MALPWIEKFKDAKILGELATQYLAANDVPNAHIQLQLAVAKYRDILDNENLIPQAKNLVEQKLKYEKERLTALNQYIKSKIKQEMKTRHSPVKELKIKKRK